MLIFKELFYKVAKNIQSLRSKVEIMQIAPKKKKKKKRMKYYVVKTEENNLKI